MLVQYKNTEALRDPYWGLRDDVQYRALGISTTLDDYPGQIRKETRHVIVVDRCSQNENEETIGRANFVPIDWLEIVDYSYPDDWGSAIISENIINPILVFGFKELLDADFNLRIHDLNEDPGDNELLAKKLEEYGGNNFIHSRLVEIRNMYVNAEQAMGTVLDDISKNPKDVSLTRKYAGLLLEATVARMKIISATDSTEQKKVLAENAMKNFYHVNEIKRNDIEMPEKFKNIFTHASGSIKNPPEITYAILELATKNNFSFN